MPFQSECRAHIPKEYDLPDREGQGHVKAAIIAGIFTLIAAVIGGAFLIANTLIQQGTISISAPTPTKIIDSIVGVWSGSARTGTSGSAPVSFTFVKTCTIDSTCGSFSLPTIPCSGTFRIVSVSGNTFYFVAENKQGACGKATEEYFQLLPDGTLEYFSRGDYGESKGILKRVEK